MDWMTVTVSTTTELGEVVSQMMIDSGSRGAMIEDINDLYQNQRPEGMWDIIDDALFERMGTDCKVTGYYPKDDSFPGILSALKEKLNELPQLFEGVNCGTLYVTVNSLDDEDWAENWKKDLKPMRLGNYTVVVPSWTQYEPKENDRIINLDPGMAFGTGSHETTALCAGLIEEYTRPGDTVFDVGTGTGILAMVAYLAGANNLLATDLDPVAVNVATENVKNNHMDDKIKLLTGDLLEVVSGTADIVVANIISDVIRMLAKPVRANIKHGGYFICSGISRERKQEVLDALNEAGYEKLDIRDKGEWTAIACLNP